MSMTIVMVVLAVGTVTVVVRAIAASVTSVASVASVASVRNAVTARMMKPETAPTAQAKATIAPKVALRQLILLVNIWMNRRVRKHKKQLRKKRRLQMWKPCCARLRQESCRMTRIP